MGILEVECGKFLIRYEIEIGDENTPIALDAKVWLKERAPIDEVPLFLLRTKWDGCSHLDMIHLHFDGMEEFDEFAACVRFIYDDLCELHGVGD